MPINTQQLYCPSCAHPSLQVKNDKAFICTHCEFTYFHNTASAVMAVICHQDNVLVAVRGREPGKGMQAADDVSAIYWVPVNELNLDKFAFDSAKQALSILGLVMPD